MLSVNVYRNIETPTGNPWFLESWTPHVKNLNFTSKVPGGFSECSLTVDVTNEKAFAIYSYYHGYYLKVIGGNGNTAWYGRIEDVTYEPGQATVRAAGMWSHMFDSFYDDYSFSGDPGAEHYILNADSTRELNATYRILAQSFQLDEDLAIRDIAIRLTNDGTGVPGDYLLISLRPDSSGDPHATEKLAEVEIQVETIASEETIFTGMNTSYRLNANTAYWIQVNAYNRATADSIGWRYDSTSGYTDGSMKYWTGAAWSAFSGDAIFYIWTHPRFYYYSVDVENGDFEDNDASSDFDDWTENAGTGAVAVETTNVYEGDSAVKLTAGSSADTYLYQDFEVIKGSDYTLTFYTRGDGTYAGRYRIYDVTNSADITATTGTGVTGTTYTAVNADFTVPASCTRARVYFYCPSTNTGIAYFDYASIDGDFSTSADIVYDAVTHATLIENSRGDFVGDGAAQVNPIAFTNNERPGDVIDKLLVFGDGEDPPSPMNFMIYENAMPIFKAKNHGTWWHVTADNVVIGQQGISLSSSLKNMYSRVSVLYSGVVGERNRTTWNVADLDFYHRHDYHRDGLFSIAGATEAVADIISDVVAESKTQYGQMMQLLISGGVEKFMGGGIKYDPWEIRAGDIIVISNVAPFIPREQSSFTYYYADSVRLVSVKETSYDAQSERLSVVPIEMSGDIIDVILALAGLSGGSMI